MSEIVLHDVDRITSGEFRRASIGIEPSGRAHIGNALTFLQGMMVAAASPQGSLDVTVTDLAFHFNQGNSFPSFHKKPDPYGCHELHRDHTMEEAAVMLGDMAKYLGVSAEKVRVHCMEDYSADPDLQKLLGFLFGTPKGNILLKNSVANQLGSSRELLAVVCEDCGYSTRKRLRSNDGFHLHANCANEDCDKDKLVTALDEPGRVNFHYTLDPVRDLTLHGAEDPVDLHIFGGDYQFRYGKAKHSRPERILTLFEGISPNAPSLAVGPVLYCNGSKMSKSRGNGHGVMEFRDLYSNWVERLHDLLLHHPNNAILDVCEQPKYFS